MAFQPLFVKLDHCVVGLTLFETDGEMKMFPSYFSSSPKTCNNVLHLLKVHKQRSHIELQISQIALLIMYAA